MADTAPRSATATAVQRLAASLVGRALLPDDAGYDEARTVWNGMIDRRPELIVRCAVDGDVVRALDFARERQLPVTVKSGGHHVAGKAICEAGLVIDLSPMNGVRVDPKTRTARVGPGARWGDFDREAQASGLATTGGVHSGTGVAGLTLGGGIGYLARSFGLAADNLRAADVVLADGARVRASAEENNDLLWALRGGGGACGVVTELEFQLHEVGPEVMTGQFFYPYESIGDVLRGYRAIMSTAPDELAVYALIVHVPPIAAFPESAHGTIALALVACFSGSVEKGETAMAPLRRLGEPLLEVVQPMPYATLQQSFDAGAPDGARYYYKSHYLQDLSDGAISTILARIEPLPGAFTVVGIEPMGGAINRVDRNATAYPHRDAAFNFSVWSGWSDAADDDEIIAWTRSFQEAMTPYSTGGTYLNYMDRDEATRTAAAYGDNHARLRAVKAKYDPDGLFRTD